MWVPLYILFLCVPFFPSVLFFLRVLQWGLCSLRELLWWFLLLFIHFGWWRDTRWWKKRKKKICLHNFPFLFSPSRTLIPIFIFYIYIYIFLFLSSRNTRKGKFFSLWNKHASGDDDWRYTFPLFHLRHARWMEENLFWLTTSFRDESK